MRHRHLISAALLFLVVTTALPQAMPPVITSISPTSIVAGSPGFTLMVTGQNFISGAQVRVNTAPRTTQFVSATRLNVTIPNTDLTTVRNLSITAANPGTAASAPVTFRVVSNTPAITNITPSTIAVGSSDTTITVNGTGFASTAMVRLNTTNLTTTFVTEMQLTARVPRVELTTARTANVTVFNPSPFNKTSNAVTLTVSSTVVPTITLLSPNPVVAGGPGFTLTITGQNFLSSSIVRVNNVTQTSTFVNSTTITTPITASQIATARTFTITVTNPPNLTSPAATLTVTSGSVPSIQSITPTSVQAGSATFTLALTGMNFVSGSVVRLNGSNRTTTFVDSTHLNATIPAADVAAERTYDVTVMNPAPNGGTSSAVTLTVFNQNAPIITSLSPSAFATATPSPKLTVTGSRFLLTDDDVVLVDGAPRTTDFVNTTTLVATLLDDDVASPGTHTVRVTNKNNFTSAPLTFVVSSQAGPVITSIDPPTTQVGATPFTATLTGVNFNDQSIVTIDTAPRATTFVSPTQLQVQITANDLSSARTLSVSVLNPDGTTASAVELPILLVPPAITALSPSQAIAGSTGFTLAISGTGFSSTSVVRLNGVTRPATFDAPTGRLLVSLTSADLFASGNVAVTVTGPGGTSTASLLAVNGPVITAVIPNAITAGSPMVTIAVEGTGFLPTSMIVFLGVPRSTTFDPVSGRLSTTLFGADLSVTGQVAVIVQNTTGAVSAPFLITISTPGNPRIDSIAPAQVFTNASTAELTINGANFLNGAAVKFDGVDKPTDFVSTTQLTVTLGAADLAAPHDFAVTVSNPDGTVSTAVTFSVVAAPPAAGPRRRSVRH